MTASARTSWVGLAALVVVLPGLVGTLMQTGRASRLAWLELSLHALPLTVSVMITTYIVFAFAASNHEDIGQYGPVLLIFVAIGVAVGSLIGAWLIGDSLIDEGEKLLGFVDESGVRPAGRVGWLATAAAFVVIVFAYYFVTYGVATAVAAISGGAWLAFRTVRLGQVAGRVHERRRTSQEERSRQDALERQRTSPEQQARKAARTANREQVRRRRRDQAQARAASAPATTPQPAAPAPAPAPASMAVQARTPYKHAQCPLCDADYVITFERASRPGALCGVCPDCATDLGGS